MRLHRFYTLQPLGEVVVITDGSVLNQWKNVFRYTQGVLVILFNGDGNEYTYSIDSITSASCNLTLLSHSPSYIPTKKVTLYLSLIKKDNFELVVQKVTELGVTNIVPIMSSRSEKKNLNEERLSKITVEASEQCGRGDVPTVSPIITLSKALGEIKNKESSFVLQMGGTPFSDTKLQEIVKGSSDVNLFIGPEGGWSTDEEEIFNNLDISSVSLGNTVLRAETAAIVSCAFTLL